MICTSDAEVRNRQLVARVYELVAYSKHAYHFSGETIALLSTNKGNFESTMTLEWLIATMIHLTFTYKLKELKNDDYV